MRGRAGAYARALGGSGLGDVKQQAKPRAHRRRAFVDTGRLGADVPDMRRKDGVLMQLDSELPSCEQGGEVMFGSGGILYVFWCERTRVSAFFMQCT